MLLAQLSLLAQDTTEVLMTVNGRAITAQEFVQAYTKNQALVKDASKNDIDKYLQLYKIYKLKVARAYDLKLDRNEVFQKDLANYRRQLSRKYISRGEVTDQLIAEAYERTVTEINARHILFKLDQDASPSDTLKVYNQALAIKHAIENGASFTALAKKHSADPSVTKNEGEMGFFGAFKMVYPFESAAYNTPLGKLSNPIRTQFGYHLIEPLAKRKNKGKRVAAHILVTKKSVSAHTTPEKTINELYERVLSGESFKDLALQYSADKHSAQKGGQINPFAKGQLRSSVFEDKVFELDTIGAITVPFKTVFGWHIAKLISKEEIAEFDKLAPELSKRIRNSSRGNIISSALSQKLRKKYNLSIDSTAIHYFNQLVTKEVLNKKWKLEQPLQGGGAPLFAFRDTTITYLDAAKFLEKRQRKEVSITSVSRFVSRQLSSFLDVVVRDYYAAHLETEHPEFASVMREYKEGLLLFEVMQKEVWDKAAADLKGQKQYFNSHKKDFMFPKRMRLVTFSATDKKQLDVANELYLSGKSLTEIENIFRKEKKGKLFSQNQLLALTDARIPKLLKPKAGQEYINIRENRYDLYYVVEVFEGRQKKFNEAVSEVSNLYQQLEEKKYVEKLLDTAQISVNKEVLAEIKSNLANQ